MNGSVQTLYTLRERLLVTFSIDAIGLSPNQPERVLKLAILGIDIPKRMGYNYGISSGQGDIEMTYYNPPHAVMDETKLQSMIATLNSGGTLPPVIVLGEYAFTGSHRLAAWDRCDMQPEVVEVSETDYIAAMEYAGLDPMCDEIYDHNEFCDALFAVTDDTAVKAAIYDQRG